MSAPVDPKARCDYQAAMYEWPYSSVVRIAAQAVGVAVSMFLAQAVVRAAQRELLEARDLEPGGEAVPSNACDMSSAERGCVLVALSLGRFALLDGRHVLLPRELCPDCRAKAAS